MGSEMCIRDSNNSESGDRAFKTSLTLNESSAGAKTGVAIQKLNIYPNPAHDYITLPEIQGKSTVSMQLTDLTGKSLVIPWNPRIDISSLTPGMYIVRALGANGSVNGTGIFLKM